ncbi:Do family serine endopeptidase [Dichotomicrobium thermohalophilum]|uniref:Probable periplasmic serine endoprotease DegP-like n=1 Tax=Dichotomicrobium thermohalophilum TaxID=933063 RepID=A0A397PP11_9HYPH|nr:Do family serine endopeptidase [Dichotomicrobium thermohalophilum]RIA47774.1 serine protease Do [Dichotomicrobium thermohalophilum]
MTFSRISPARAGALRANAAYNAAAALLLAATIWLGLAAPALARGPEPVSELAKDLQGAVVNISTTQLLSNGPSVPVPRAPEGSPFDELFEDFLDERGQARRINSLGSGFVIDPSGLIVTNNHVIENADEIIVNFADGRKLTVTEVIGRDDKTDLALLRVEPDEALQAVPFGDSAKMEVGDWVMAIGNPFGLGGSVSLGIVSAVKRDINAGPYDAFIQTDAAINRGNSGGPLFNMDGEVIGVNTAIISPTGGSIGIGFALPANTAQRVIAQLREYGETRRGWIGVRIQDLNEEIAASLGMDEAKGALVAAVTPDGPAAEAGIEVGDVIVRFNDKPVNTVRQLPRVVAETPIGAEVPVVVNRRGERVTLKLTVGRLVEDENETAVKPMEDDQGDTVLGLSLSALSDPLRDEYGIAEDVEGVIVTDVAPGSGAAERDITPGSVIVEVSHKPVSTPDEVRARVAELKELGRATALLLFALNADEMKFVALPLDP